MSSSQAVWDSPDQVSILTETILEKNDQIVKWWCEFSVLIILTRSSLWFSVRKCNIIISPLPPGPGLVAGGGCMFCFSESDVDWEELRGRGPSVERWEITPVRPSQAQASDCHLPSPPRKYQYLYHGLGLLWSPVIWCDSFMLPALILPLLDLVEILKSMTEKHTYKQCMASLFLQPILYKFGLEHKSSKLVESFSAFSIWSNIWEQGNLYLPVLLPCQSKYQVLASLKWKVGNVFCLLCVPSDVICEEWSELECWWGGPGHTDLTARPSEDF